MILCWQNRKSWWAWKLYGFDRRLNERPSDLVPNDKWLFRMDGISRCRVKSWKMLETSLSFTPPAPDLTPFIHLFILLYFGSFVTKHGIIYDLYITFGKGEIKSLGFFFPLCFSPFISLTPTEVMKTKKIHWIFVISSQPSSKKYSSVLFFFHWSFIPGLHSPAQSN